MKYLTIVFLLLGTSSLGCHRAGATGEDDPSKEGDSSKNDDTTEMLLKCSLLIQSLMECQSTSDEDDAACEELQSQVESQCIEALTNVEPELVEELVEMLIDSDIGLMIDSDPEQTCGWLTCEEAAPLRLMCIATYGTDSVVCDQVSNYQDLCC